MSWHFLNPVFQVRHGKGWCRHRGLGGSVSFVCLKMLAVFTHAVIVYFRMRRGETLFIEHPPSWAEKDNEETAVCGTIRANLLPAMERVKVLADNFSRNLCNGAWTIHTHRESCSSWRNALSALLPHECALGWLLWTPQAINTSSRAAFASMSECSLTTLGNSSLKSQMSVFPVLAFATHYNSCSLKYCVDRLFSWYKTLYLQ